MKSFVAFASLVLSLASLSEASGGPLAAADLHRRHHAKAKRCLAHASKSATPIAAAATPTIATSWLDSPIGNLLSTPAASSTPAWVPAPASSSASQANGGVAAYAQQPQWQASSSSSSSSPSWDQSGNTWKAAAVVNAAASTPAVSPVNTWTPAATSSPAAPATPATGGAASGAGTVGHATFYYQEGAKPACQNPPSGITVPFLDTAQIVALYTDAFGNGEHCWKNVQVTNAKTGASTTAMVVDRCMGCGGSVNNIDLSLGAFTAIGNTVDGNIDITWQYV